MSRRAPGGYGRRSCGVDPASPRSGMPRAGPAADHGRNTMAIRRVTGAMRRVVLTLLLAVAVSLAAHAQSCVPITAPDWIASIPVSSSSVRVWPADCATVEQSPPDFSWPDLSSDAQYRVALTYPDGHTRTLDAPQNWINWDEALPAGSYAWQ